MKNGSIRVGRKLKIYQFGLPIPKNIPFQLKVSSIQTSELPNHLDYICLHTHYAISLTFDYFYQM